MEKQKRISKNKIKQCNKRLTGMYEKGAHELSAINRKLRKNQGQTLVEMAFILPIILMIIMGVVEFGRIFNAYLIITNATREGARMAAVGGSDADVANSISKSTVTLDSSKMNIQVQPTEDLRKKGDEVSITIGYNLEIICPIISAIVPNPFPLTSTTVMRME